MKVAGVTQVDVSFESKHAVVEGEPCDTEAMIAALSKAGYRAQLK